MQIELNAGDKLKVVTADSCIEIEAGSWWDSELKSSDTYTSIEATSQTEGKHVHTKRLLMDNNGSDYDRQHVRVHIRRDTTKEQTERLPESERINKLIAEVKRLRDKDRRERNNYHSGSKNYAALESAATTLDFVLTLIEEGVLDH